MPDRDSVTKTNMTSLPIPFVVAFLVLLLAASSHQELKKTPTGRAFAIALYIYAASTVLIGLRWSMGWANFLPLAATLSVAGTALLYLAYCSLGRSGPVVFATGNAWHLIPIGIVLASTFLHTQWLEVLWIAAKLLYAGLMIKLARDTPGSLQLVRLGWLHNTHRALWGTVALLLASVALDIAIVVDFAYYDGQHSASMVGMANFAVLLLLAWVSIQAGRGRVQESEVNVKVAHTGAESEQAEKPESLAVDTADTELMNKLNKLLIDDRLYADTELNLQKLARKSGVPARAVSQAINANTGQNLSQWVNSARIEAVCELLQDKDKTVGEAMLEAGFLTKSNFNREFRRIKGCSPSDWRGSRHD